MASSSENTEKLSLPNSKDSELLILGSMLTREDSLNYACDKMVEEDFYYFQNQLLFSAIKALHSKGSPVDIYLTAERLKSDNHLDKIGGIQTLVTVSQYAGTSVHIEAYCDIVKEKSILRKLIRSTEQTRVKAINEPQDPFLLIEEHQKTIYEITKDGKENDPMPIKDIVDGKHREDGLSFMENIKKLMEDYKNGHETITGIQTGFDNLDKMINGLVEGQLIIIGARPSMGKTTFALNICANIAIQGNKPVAVFSLEMTKSEVLNKIVSMTAGVSAKDSDAYRFTDMDAIRIAEATKVVRNSPITIDDQPGMRIAQIRNKARRLKELYGIKCIIIDYLGLIQGENRYGNRNEDISLISESLKNLAKELSIPVVCLSQLSRKSEEDNRKPRMSDLRDSGQVEANADIVILMHREDRFDPTNKPNQVELIIPKNRHGDIGSVFLYFEKSYGKMAPLEPFETERARGTSMFSEKRLLTPQAFAYADPLERQTDFT